MTSSTDLRYDPLTNNKIETSNNKDECPTTGKRSLHRCQNERVEESKYRKKIIR